MRFPHQNRESFDVNAGLCPQRLTFRGGVQRHVNLISLELHLWGPWSVQL